MRNREHFCSNRGPLRKEQGRLRAREPDALVGRRQVRQGAFRRPARPEAPNARATDRASAGRRGGAPAARTAQKGVSEPQPRCKEQGAPRCRTGDVSAGTGNICSRTGKKPRGYAGRARQALKAVQPLFASLKYPFNWWKQPTVNIYNFWITVTLVSSAAGGGCRGGDRL